MYKKIVLLVVLCFLFTISCSSPSNPNNDNNGDGGSTVPPPITTPTEEELIKKYGIDIGQADEEISKQIEANLKAYHDEMGSYRVILTGTPKDSYSQNSNKSLYILTLEAALKVSSSMNIELDIKNINFQDGSVKTGMFSGEVIENSENVVINFRFPENKIKTIEMDSFDWEHNTKEIRIPDSVITIGNTAFQYSANIEKLILGNSIVSIGEQAFIGIEYLKELLIPESVTSIGTGAFAQSEYVEKITIPASVKSIGSMAFVSCPSLTTVVYNGTSPDTIQNNDAFLYCDKLSSLIVPNAPETTTEALKSKWQNFLGGKFTDVRKE
ncbi:leucine-rich repeat domain-containing protein [Brachyspira pilosicoli]|uniref:leucine-rich repeat domain-containing protein n=1 Tax=Brachyspira pilosicoli TaxID=52584 RepID=UPI001C66E40F|nr:leucine-rich repeat domain-containing protein [Brachyspira pilosicoli]MBW5396424.1 leucine-rich repeat domain-containing protein [Brachyspira pilosicoli]